ncbi:MAG TPA: hypothetical protein VN495_03630 [Candidatus Paceibacterota bacterium]|nr:hypothetical protein [Candidatus Paceibacterota bacterium]
MAAFVTNSHAPEVTREGLAITAAKEALEEHAGTLAAICQTRTFGEHPIYRQIVSEVAGGKPAGECVNFYRRNTF